MTYRLGVDIGGTFTDATLVDEATGAVRIAKVSSTPHDPSQGFMAATERILAQSEVEPESLRYVVHATTVATNAIIEGRIARTALVTTEGFRDVLEIGRQVRPTLYDVHFEKPRPLVPRNLCFGVRERLEPDGSIRVALDEGSVRDVAARICDAGVEAIAVCLLHAYVNGEHERGVGAILRELVPDALVSLSSDVAPEFREYLRASTTAINAGIQPLVARYVESIEHRLRGSGVAAELLVMQSSGGVFSAAAAAARPVFMVESGPAAGVIAAAALGEALDERELISFDMGGTTAKVGLIQDGSPRVTKDYQVGAAARAGIGGLALSGYPVRTPVIDLVEIGAGGGSIAWTDSGGLLRVGPQSAGSDPGPVCYGRGGEQPTVTDANLVLGRLNPDYFLGGEIVLDVHAAGAAIDERCARPLGLTVVEAANGIVEIANAAMANALNLISVQRGYDPRGFVLAGFGGAGPAHANALARDVGIPALVIPVSPGTFSASGLLATDLKRDYTTAVLRRAESLDRGEIEIAFERMEAEGRRALERERVASDDIAFERAAELRYVGQSYELTVPADDVAAAVVGFHAEHDRAYGFSAETEPVEVVNLRLTAIGRIAKPQLRELSTGSDPRPRATRAVYFAELDGYVDTPVFDRYALGAGAVLAGPAVVEELDSTTIVHPAFGARVDRHGNLHIARV